LQYESSSCRYYIHEHSVTVVEGKDSIKHINRIITSNIAEIKDLENCKSLICDANGKITDALDISSISGQLLILGVKENAEKTRELIVSGTHWNEDVKIMNGDGALKIISIFAKNQEKLSKALGIEISTMRNDFWIIENESYILKAQLKNDFQVNILIQADLIDSFIKTVEGNGAELCGEDNWNIHRVENGILSNEEYNRGFLPGELGLDEIVDLKKGCYPGQEIHARLESRGKLSKKIMRFRTDSKLDVGTYISNTGRKVRVTSSLGNQGFAVISVKENNELKLNDELLILTEEL
tara:strand:+ start:42 stop:929 length:888 start_codon:yes stop_codon:yes gene_type:complete